MTSWTSLTVLFLFPAVVPQVWDVIVFYTPLNIPKVLSSVLLWKLVSHIVSHLQSLSISPVYVPHWPVKRFMLSETTKFLDYSSNLNWIQLLLLNFNSRKRNIWRWKLIIDYVHKKTVNATTHQVKTYGRWLRLYGGSDTIIWLRVETMMRMKMGISCTNRARPPYWATIGLKHVGTHLKTG